MLGASLRQAFAACSSLAALFGPLIGGEAAPPAVPSPRIAMLWSSVRSDRSPEAIARHDLALLGTDALGLEFDRQPAGLAEGFTPASIEAARKKIAEIRRLKPGIVLLGEIYFYEWSDRWLPEDHPWWLRKDGKREQFWPGTHRMDWNNPEYRKRVAGWTVSLQSSGADGAFFDNLREEPGPWSEFLAEVRRRAGDRFLILANAGYAVGKHDFAAPLLNGFLYESGWSHGRTEWDAVISAIRLTEVLLMEPRISVIERFEDTGDRAGWPGDPKRGQKPPADPKARRWSLCFALIVGDFHYLFSDNTSHHHDWYPEYDVKIGGPSGPPERLGPHRWRRLYDKALVEMNLPGAKESVRVELEAEATDVLSGEKGRTFEIPPGDGRILLGGVAKAPPADAATEKTRAKILEWAEVLAESPDPAIVTDPKLLRAIQETHLPWRVRDKKAGVEMLLIPPGVLESMNEDDNDAEPSDGPRHRLAITAPFYIGRYEVRQKEWMRALGGKNPSSISIGDDYPVDSASFYDIQGFLAAVSMGLPAPDEWEYACRAGTHPARYAPVLADIAWSNRNSEGKTHPVGGKKPNAFGLHDTLGNVYEWCRIPGRTRHAIRGGSALKDNRFCRASRALYYEETRREPDLGFRVVRTP